MNKEIIKADKEDIKTDRISTRSDIVYITRRRTLRIPFNMRIKYGLIKNSIYKEHSEPRLGGFVVNLSEDGLALEGLKSLPPDSVIRACLYTGENTLMIEGRVKWSELDNKEKCKMGIEFTGRSDKIKEIYTRTLFKNRFGL